MAESRLAAVGGVAPRGRLVGRQQLVYAPAIEVDDFKTPILFDELLTDVRDALQPVEREAGGSVKVASVGKGQTQGVGKLLDRGVARDQDRTVFTANDMLFGRTLLGPKRSDDRFQDVGGCH